MSASDARYECASRHAEAIRAAADALSTAIYEASRDGYRATIALKGVVGIGNSAFIGNGTKPMHVAATIAFDIGGKVGL